MSDTRTEASPLVSLFVGGRKLVALSLALAALVWGPEAAHGSIVSALAMYVGGNGWEHHTRRARPGAPPKAAP